MAKFANNNLSLRPAICTFVLFAVCFLSLNGTNNVLAAESSDLNSSLDNIDPALISTADTSTLLAAVADGINPNDKLLSTTFYCYSTETTDTSTPDVTLVIEGNKVNYQSEAQSGTGRIEQQEDTDQVIITADGGTQKFRLELTQFGQILKWPVSDNLMDDCVQQGAAHNSALHQYSLNTPKPSEFICWDNNEEKTEHKLELLENNSYRINGELGRYNVIGRLRNRPFERFRS